MYSKKFLRGICLYVALALFHHVQAVEPIHQNHSIANKSDNNQPSASILVPTNQKHTIIPQTNNSNNNESPASVEQDNRLDKNVPSEINETIKCFFPYCFLDPICAFHSKDFPSALNPWMIGDKEVARLLYPGVCQNEVLQEWKKLHEEWNSDLKNYSSTPLMDDAVVKYEGDASARDKDVNALADSVRKIWKES